MAGPSRTPQQRIAARAYVVREVCRGRTYAEIAGDLGVSLQQVAYDWGKAQKDFEDEIANRFQGWVRRKLLKLDTAADLAMQCWLATMQPTTESEWIGPAPLSDDDAQKLATLADADEELAKAMREVGAGHWRPKKLNPAKPNPSFALAYAALTRLAFEAVGALQARAKNEAPTGAGELPGGIPRAADISTLEEAAGPLEMLESMGGGRLLRYAKKA